MHPLLPLREARGLSQRRLAQKAGVSYKTVQLIESGRHDPRWSTLARLARTLGLEPAALAQSLGSGRAGEESARSCSLRIVRDGEGSWKIHLFELVDAWRRAPDPRLLAEAPDPKAGPRALVLLAATLEALCAEAGIPPPWWCAGVDPLPDPWFVASSEDLKASALVESPAQFRQRNVFVLGNFLSRA